MKLDLLSKPKQRIILTIIFLICVLFMFFPYSAYYARSLLTGTALDLNHTFLIKYDYTSQAISYYREFYRLIDSGNVLYSWNLFLGGSYFVSKTLFTVGDPFSLLGYIPYHFGASIPTILFILSGLKLVLGGLFFSRFLESYKIKFSVRIPFCVAFMFSGWATIFLEQPYFLSWYCLIPIMLIGIEEYLRNHKKGWFFFGSLLLLLTNYYLTWSFCIYILVYWCIRWYSLNQNFGKTFWVSSFKILGIFLVALLCSGFLLVPSIFLLINNPRLSSVQQSYSFWSKDNLLSLLMNFFIPVVKYDPATLLYHDSDYYFYQIGIYSGILPLLLIPQYFKQAPKKEKMCFAILLAFCVLSLVSPIIGKLIFRSYSLRYTYWFVPTLLTLGALVLNNHTPCNKKTLWITECVIVVIMLILGVFYPLLSGLSILDYPESKMLIIGILFSLVYTVCLTKVTDKSKKIIFVVCCCFSCLELSLNANRVIDSQTKWTDQAEYIENQPQVDSVYQALRDYDSSFYRINLVVANMASESDLENNGMYYGIPTIKTYDSTYDYNLHDYLDWMRLYPDVEWNLKFDEPTSFSILDAKYSIVSALADQSYYQYYGTEVVLPNVSENYRVYLHNGEIHLGRSYSSFVEESSITDLANEPNQYVYDTVDLLNNSLAVSDDKVASLNKEYTNTTTHYLDTNTFTNHSISISSNANEDAYYFLSIPYNQGWTITIDGQEVAYDKVQGGFIGLAIPKGNHEISLSFTPVGFNAGIITSIVGGLLALSLLIQTIYISKKKAK